MIISSYLYSIFLFQNWHLLLPAEYEICQISSWKGCKGEKATLLEIKQEICQHLAKLHMPPLLTACLVKIELFVPIALEKKSKEKG